VFFLLADTPRKRTWTDAVKTDGEHLTEQELLILRGQMAYRASTFSTF
jgi:hypothetical protein